MTSVDHRDLAIDLLAEENQQLRERIANLEADVATYRELTCVTFDALHDLTARHQKLQESSTRQHAESLAFRERQLLQAGADESEDVPV